MNIAQSLMLALAGCFVSMTLMAEDVAEAAQADVEDVSGFSITCGFQGKYGHVKTGPQEVLAAFEMAAATCESVGNTDAHDWYSEKAAACSENKSNCLLTDYRDMQRSWCGHIFSHPIDQTDRYATTWAKNIMGLLEKAKMACQKDPDAVEVAAAEQYFSQLSPDTCKVNNEQGATDQGKLPELCASMYHALGKNGAPY